MAELFANDIATVIRRFDLRNQQTCDSGVCIQYLLDSPIKSSSDDTSDVSVMRVGV